MRQGYAENGKKSNTVMLFSGQAKTLKMSVNQELYLPIFQQ